MAQPSSPDTCRKVRGVGTPAVSVAEGGCVSNSPSTEARPLDGVVGS
jgi:hypothetical protein